MGAQTKIEWATSTFNPWIGCTKVSPGCANCYAELLDRNRMSKTMGAGTSANPESHWGPGAPRVRTSASNWKQPLRWDRQFAKALNDYGNHETLHGGLAKYPRPTSPRVFCASLADWLDPQVPRKWRHDLLDLIQVTTNLTWLLLTKRPERWRQLMLECAAAGSSLAQHWVNGTPPPNVHAGCTVEDQPRATERCEHLRAIPAPFYFVSYEPGLGLVDWKGFEFIDQLICGGESGPGARPMHPHHARAAREWCEGADVSFFFKQWGDWLPEHQEPATKSRDGAKAAAVHTFADGVKTYRVGKICAGRLLDGVQYDNMPVPF